MNMPSSRKPHRAMITVETPGTTVKNTRTILSEFSANLLITPETMSDVSNSRGGDDEEALTQEHADDELPGLLLEKYTTG